MLWLKATNQGRSWANSPNPLIRLNSRLVTMHIMRQSLSAVDCAELQRPSRPGQFDLGQIDFAGPPRPAQLVPSPSSPSHPPLPHKIWPKNIWAYIYGLGDMCVYTGYEVSAFG